MKKIAVLLMVFSMLFAVTSCSFYDIFQDIVDGPKPDDDPVEKPGEGESYVEMTDGEYDKINALVPQKGDDVTVSVTTESLGVVLIAEYVIKENELSYTIEKLNMLPEDGDVSKLPESMTELYTGEATRDANGNFVDENNDKIDLPADFIGSGFMKFDEDNFRDAKRYADRFEGEVISVLDFLGVELEVEVMTVRVDYSDDAISSVVINYTEGDTSVTITYTL